MYTNPIGEQVERRHRPQKIQIGKANMDLCVRFVPPCSYAIVPTLRNPNTAFPSPFIISILYLHIFICLRMLSSQSLSGETIAEKLLDSDDEQKGFADCDSPAASKRYQARWRILAIVSSSLLLISLWLNFFQYRTGLQRWVERPYIYCEVHH